MTLPVPDPAVSAAQPPAPASKLTERPHPLTPFIRGWVVLLAIVISVGRELLPDGGSEPAPLPPLAFILAGIALIVLAAGLAGYISWRFTRFVIDANELRIDTGAVFRSSQRIAFDKVQSIDVVQPLAARLFGLAELQIDVGADARTKLRYLQLARAYALRDYLLSRARGHQATIAETRPASILQDLTSHDEVLVRVTPRTLLLAAATSHEFLLLLAGSVFAVVAAWWWQQPWLGIAFGFSTVSGLIGFIGRRVTGQFNYTLSRRPSGLRISRGLISLTSQSLPPRRIQAIQISQSLLWRPLGLYRVDLDVIGWGALTDNEDKTGVSTILLPAGSIDQVRVALGAIWPTASFEAVELRPAPDRARWLHPLSGPFLRWGYDEQLIVSRHGWLVRRWQLVPTARTQSVRIVQGLVSRRLRLADLEFHTAGMQISGIAQGADADQVLSIQAHLLAQVHQRRDRDISEPSPTLVTPAVVQPGTPPAWRADQAEDTISSSE